MSDGGGGLGCGWPDWEADADFPTRSEIDVDAVAAAHRFVIAEAALLDADRLEDWLRLFDVEALYWMPMDRRATDPHAQLNLIFDDLRLLSDRVFRIRTGDAHTQDPPSSIMRSVTSIRVRRASSDLIEVRSACTLSEARRGDVRNYVARWTHVLRITDEGFLIHRKRIDLASGADVLPSITFLF